MHLVNLLRDNLLITVTLHAKFENKNMCKEKISIRFFDDPEVHAIWDEENAKWLVLLTT